MILAFLIFFSAVVLALCTAEFVNICRTHIPATEIVVSTHAPKGATKNKLKPAHRMGLMTPYTT